MPEDGNIDLGSNYNNNYYCLTWCLCELDLIELCIALCNNPAACVLREAVYINQSPEW